MPLTRNGAANLQLFCDYEVVNMTFFRFKRKKIPIKDRESLKNAVFESRLTICLYEMTCRQNNEIALYFFISANE